MFRGVFFLLLLFLFLKTYPHVYGVLRLSVLWRRGKGVRTVDSHDPELGEEKEKVRLVVLLSMNGGGNVCWGRVDGLERG